MKETKQAVTGTAQFNVYVLDKLVGTYYADANISPDDFLSSYVGNNSNVYVIKDVNYKNKKLYDNAICLLSIVEMARGKLAPNANQLITNVLALIKD